MATRLSIYNGALRLIGETKLSALTENRAARRHLDDAWDDSLIDYCLEAGLWNFATRTTERVASSSVTPAFGLAYAFDRPDDFIRTVALCSDERFSVPLLNYHDEAGYWLADLETIYVKYVSNDASYGGDLSLWPQTFVRYVEAELACRSVIDITQSHEKLKVCDELRRRALSDALSKDAMAQPTSFPPMGSWASARRSGGGNRSRWNGSTTT